MRLCQECGTQFLTWIQQQVAGEHVLHGHIGAEFNALYLSVAAVEVEGERVLQIQHQAGPTH